LIKEGFTVKDYSEKFWEKRFTIMWIGAIFTQFFIDIIRSHVGHHHLLMRWFFPFVVSLSGILAFPIDKQHPQAHIVPHFRANHPVNATGCVEKIKCVLMEWTTPISNINELEGFRMTRDAYRALLMNMVGHYTKFHDSNPYRALPVSIAAELRIIKACDTIISPTAARPGFTHMGCPEVVSHSLGNKYFKEFLLDQHEQMKSILAKQKQPLYVHLGKQGWEFPDFLAWSVSEYDKWKPDGKESSLVLFNRERQKADPTGMFMTPFFNQWLNRKHSSYHPPSGTYIDTVGSFELNKTQTI